MEEEEDQGLVPDLNLILVQKGVVVMGKDLSRRTGTVKEAIAVEVEVRKGIEIEATIRRNIVQRIAD